MKKIFSFIGALVIWQMGTFMYAQGPPAISNSDLSSYAASSVSWLNMRGAPLSHLTYATFETASIEKENPLLSMTTAQREAIASPVAGLEIFNLDNQHMEVFDGVGWVNTSAINREADENPAPPTGDSWMRKADYLGVATSHAIGFSIGNFGYIGLGVSNEFWRYDPSSDSWSQRAQYLGDGAAGCIGFSIGDLGYSGMGLGREDGIVKSDFWEYNPSQNLWTQKGNFPGLARYVAVSFCIGAKGYVGTGAIQDGSGLNDFWEYDPSFDSWTRKADFGGAPRTYASGFGLLGKGYIGIGRYGEGDFWEYNPFLNNWTRRADFVGGPQQQAVSFIMGNYGYLGTGSNSKQFWQYNPLDDSWLRLADFAGSERSVATGFSIGNRGYIGTGWNGVQNNDFWEYTPADSDGDGFLDATDCAPEDPSKYQSSNLYLDGDGDGFDAGQEVVCYGIDIPSGYKLTTLGTDCDDTNGVNYPGATELCDGLDNDCDAQIDEGCPRTWYRDRDKDGYGTNVNTRFQVLQPTGFVALYGDCNDNDNTIYPGAPELGDGLDNNCNGQVDEGLPCQVRWYRDADGDGSGNPSISFLSCITKTGYVDNSGDCKDNDNTVYIGAPELPDNKDNNCNGAVDEGLVCPAWYKDADHDGKGNPKIRKISCVKPDGYVDNSDDCNDADILTYAGAPELPDGKDNNCDGQIDEGLPCRVAWYFDADKDGYGNWKIAKLSCVQPTGYVSSGLDCSDNDPNINPGLQEICGDGKDNNCNGLKDEFCVLITGADPGLGSETVNNKRPLSVENQGVNQLEIGVRPNPANNVLFVDLNVFEPNKKMELELVQADGKPMIAQSLVPTIKGQQVRMDVAKLSAGYYVLLVRQGYLQQSKKVMIVR